MPHAQKFNLHKKSLINTSKSVGFIQIVAENFNQSLKNERLFIEHVQMFQAKTSMLATGYPAYYLLLTYNS